MFGEANIMLLINEIKKEIQKNSVIKYSQQYKNVNNIVNIYRTPTTNEGLVLDLIL